MAPKKAEAAAVTPSTISAGLSGEITQQLAALGQLAAAAAFSEADILSCDIVEKLVALLEQQEKSVKFLSCKLLAGYAAGTGQLQQATSTPNALQAMWSVLAAYQATESSINAALADPAAVKAAAATKRPTGGDPEDWLPGPSKYLLAAALRAICSLISQDSSVSQASDHQAAVSSTPTLISWAAEQDPAALVCLLRHMSGRVQTRAARLASQLARSCAWANSFTAAGGVHAAMQMLLSHSSTAAPHKAVEQPSMLAQQLAVMRLLLRLGESSATATAVMTTEGPLVSVLMQQLLEAGAGASAASMGKGKAAVEKPTIDARMSIGAATAAQQAAADLLAFLCSQSSAVSEQLVEAGGVTVLQQLLPEPPALHDPTAGGVPGVEQVVVGANASSKHPTPTGDPAHSASSAATPRVAASGATASATPRAAASMPAPADSVKGTPRATPRGTNTAAGTAGSVFAPVVAEGEGVDGSHRAVVAEEYLMPAQKIMLPELQAKVLKVIAAILSHSGVIQSVLAQTAADRSSLPRLLLYLFAAAPAPLSARETPDIVQSMKPVVGGATQEQGAAGVGTPSTAATAAAAAGGGLTPRKGGSTAPASGIVLKAPEPSTRDFLVPPFAIISKAASLECLAHLVQDKQMVALLAEQQQPQQEQLLTARRGTASRPGTSAGRQQQQTCSQQDNTASIPMLKQMLQDLQLLGTSSDTTVSGEHTSSPATSTGESTPAAVVQQGAADAVQQQVPLATMVNEAAAVLAGLAEHMDAQQLQHLPVLQTLKVVAKCGASQEHPASLAAQQAIARGLLLLPEEVYIAPARPPLPSPPPTPPAPPLPTSQFAWDALGRPLVTDGAVLVSNA